MPLLPLGDAAGRTRWTIEHEGRSFAVFVVGGQHYVTDARCPHNGGPLSEGWVRGERELVCPWHWYRFDLRTGRCATTDRHELGRYPVHERDGELVTEVPEPAPVRSWSEILRAHAAGER
ncbi:MAG: Rieske 2Fe-2S domain-containing protein [Pseudonocardiaceae bacterium]|nr:Rieske 2Fe-2S domain-containing protein [Pseudonocardiaceae bacterium]